ncbi:MAG: UDP-N-acetylglucosamine 2-epimerase (non-hydrolyzing) [Chloroflexi bacterium]|jgi:UDP-N-acetylglucosamine 2-epimerase (non-hydrolysing)|nr:UDP-N-acetylglucosamine 2-epimerase (non-hydrolyzing) [Chloroflexota bacterium]
MKILTILGTRPEIIRLSRVIEKLDQVSEHIVAHTGQNYDPNLNEVFFQQLGVRAPDHYFDARGSLGEQIGVILTETEKLLLRARPDKLLLLGDTNSALSAIIAKRMGIPVYHMEAGNRCYDDRVPEEVNRRIIDHSSDILMPYTERSRQNLLQEGIPGRRIYVTGNPILEVIEHYSEQIDSSQILKELDISAGEYFLVTLHRSENVDSEDRLRQFAGALDQLQKQYQLPVIISTHPRTRSKLEMFDVAVANPAIRLLPPFGFFDFVALEKNALCVLSDSGTVQEECAIFRVPNVTLRDVTERPETLECGSNMLSGADPAMIQSCVQVVLSQQVNWEPPAEYLVRNVSRSVVKIVTGFLYS